MWQQPRSCPLRHETAVQRADPDAHPRAIELRSRVRRGRHPRVAARLRRGKSMRIDTKVTILLDTTDGPTWLVTLDGGQICANTIDDIARAGLAGTDVARADVRGSLVRPLPMAMEPRLARSTQRRTGRCGPFGGDSARPVVMMRIPRPRKTTLFVDARTDVDDLAEAGPRLQATANPHQGKQPYPPQVIAFAGTSSFALERHIRPGGHATNRTRPRSTRCRRSTFSRARSAAISHLREELHNGCQQLVGVAG